MKTRLLATNYDQFRHVINTACAQHIQKYGDTTLLYNTKKHIVAAMQPARIDASGHCQPVSYYICA